MPSLSPFGPATASTPEALVSGAVLTAWPSPARGDVRVRYTVERPQHVRVVVVDLLGRAVATLADGVAGAGPQTATWNTAAASPGLYLVRLTTASGHSETARVIRR